MKWDKITWLSMSSPAILVLMLVMTWPSIGLMSPGVSLVTGSWLCQLLVTGSWLCQLLCCWWLMWVGPSPAQAVSSVHWARGPHRTGMGHQLRPGFILENYWMEGYIEFICIYKTYYNMYPSMNSMYPSDEFNIYRVSQKKQWLVESCHWGPLGWARVKCRVIFKEFRKFPILWAQKL